MEKQLTATIVVFLFCLLYTVAIAAQTRARPDAGSTMLDPVPVASGSETRAIVQQLGFGKRVNVSLRNGTKARGRITALADDHFIVTDPKGSPAAIAYYEVSRVTRQKEKLGIFHKPWVGIMFTAAGVGALIVMALACFN